MQNLPEFLSELTGSFIELVALFRTLEQQECSEYSPKLPRHRSIYGNFQQGAWLHGNPAISLLIRPER